MEEISDMYEIERAGSVHPVVFGVINFENDVLRDPGIAIRMHARRVRLGSLTTVAGWGLNP